MKNKNKIEQQKNNATIGFKERKEAFGLICGAITFACLGIYLTQDVVMPFVLGAGVAYIMTPWLMTLKGWGVPSLISAFIAVAVFFIATYLLLFGWLPLVLQEMVSLLNDIPALWQEIARKGAAIFKGAKDTTIIPLDFASMPDASQWIKAIPWRSIIDSGVFVLQSLVSGGLAIINLFGFMFITPIIAFMMLSDRDGLFQWGRSIIPQRLRPAMTEGASLLDHALATTIRGYGIVIVVMAIYYSVVFSLLAVPFAYALAFVNGILILIPFLGFVAGVLLTMMAVSFEADVSLLLVVAFVAGNLVESFYMTPRYVGEASGVHPLFFLFMVFWGGSAGGLVGAMVAAPLAAILVALWRMASHLWRESDFYRTTA